MIMATFVSGLEAREILARRVEGAIRIVPDFPRPGIRIRDISPVVEGDPDLFASVIDAMSGFFRADPPDTVMCIESWGFIFGAPVAYLLGARCGAPARKATARNDLRDLEYVLRARARLGDPS